MVVTKSAIVGHLYWEFSKSGGKNATIKPVFLWWNFVSSIIFNIILKNIKVLKVKLLQEPTSIKVCGNVSKLYYR